MVGFLARFLKDSSGATAIEYGLIAGLLAIGLITGLSSVGAAINHAFSTATSNLTTAGS
jgi:pilus assembly protein Flp/PilA